MPILMPDYPWSTYITRTWFDGKTHHKGVGDMWPLTWAADDNIYAGAGDNSDSPMNFWRVTGNPPDYEVECIDNMPIDINIYCDIPPADPEWGVKPAGLLSINGIIYFAVEAMNYGENPQFNRQRNVHGWIITSRDYGKTWNKEATPTHFFEDRLSSVHFVQFGKDYANARDDYVYANFPAADDGHSYWENGDIMLMGRVQKDRILNREAWEFIVELKDSKPTWDRDDSKAIPIFRYTSMMGENHIAYNKGIGRYIMGNYAFMSPAGEPRPYHQHDSYHYPEHAGKENTTFPCQMTLYEAPEPWGPWSLFHVDNNWGEYGGYQPNFPTKWMSSDGRRMWMVYSGSFWDYNFATQEIMLEIAA